MRAHYPVRAVVLSAARCLMAGIALLLVAGCDSQPKSSAIGERAAEIIFCHGSVTDILPWVALERGYFTEEGLAVTIRDLTDGREAFDGMLKGECNFSVQTATPIALADPQTTPFAILATILADDDSTRIVARRDHGINAPQDLKGKRIAVKKGVVGHLFLDLFLLRHGLTQADVQIVFMDSSGFQAALESGEIDGFSMTTKMVNASSRTMGERGVVFAEPGLNPIYGILTTRPDVPLNLEVAPRLLKALVRAESYVRQESASARVMVAMPLQLSTDEIDEIWKRSTAEVTLSNAIFTHLEDQYRWQVERGGSSRSAVMPRYLSLVLPEYLRMVKPEAVSVVKE